MIVFLFMDGIITHPQKILATLKSSQKNKNLVGIWASSVNFGFTTAYVETIRFGQAENDTVIILKEKKLNGDDLETQVVYLKEIEKLHRF
jgi:hypothetical protein